MNSRKRKSLPEPLGTQDIKYRLFITIKNAYDTYITKDLIKHADTLKTVLKIDFSHENAIGDFLSLSTQQINNGLSNLQKLCTRKEDPARILAKQLAVLTYSGTATYINKSWLIDILGNDKESFKLIDEDTLRIAQNEPQLTLSQYTQSVNKMDDKIVLITSHILSEIEKIFQQIRQQYTLSIQESHLLDQYHQSLIIYLNEEMQLLRQECLLVIFQVDKIDFDKIKNSITLSLGLIESPNETPLLLNYTKLILDTIQCKSKISNKDVLDNSNKDKLARDLIDLIKSRGMKRQIEILKNESLTLEAKISEDNRNQTFEKILTPFCEMEFHIFQQNNLNTDYGFFSTLKENLNSSYKNGDNEIYEILLKTSITPDNALLLKITEKHANLLARQREIAHQDAIIFEMDDVPSLSNPLSEPLPESEEILGNEIITHLKHITFLYQKLLSGENVLESDFSPKTYGTPITDTHEINGEEDEQQTLAKEKNLHAEMKPQDERMEIQQEAQKEVLNEAQNDLKEIRIETNQSSQGETLQSKAIPLLSMDAPNLVQTSQDTTEKDDDKYQVVAAQQHKAQLELQIAQHVRNNNNLNKQISQINIEKTELQKVNDNLIKDKSALVKDKSALVDDNTKLKEKADNLESAIKDLQETKSNQESEIQHLKSLTTEKLALINRQKNELQAKKMIGSFADFYKDYREFASKGFFGMSIFASHGNTGREMAKKFHKAFEVKMNSLNLDYTKSTNEVAIAIQTAFKSLVQQQRSLLLSTGNYRAHSFKTYLLAYNHYLNSFTSDQDNGLLNIKVDIIQKHHKQVFVAKKNIDVKKDYNAAFPNIALVQKKSLVQNKQVDQKTTANQHPARQRVTK